MKDKEFRHLLARMIQSSAAAEQLLEERVQLEKKIRLLEDQVMRYKPSLIEDPPGKRGHRVDMVFRIDDSCIGYKTDPKLFIEEAAETCKRELLKKLKLA